ncbi:MAG: PDGLE domain-containing protein [Candidatus Omnitrophica bacterium]|nr:PDGLE domain-containing protein [Candidatus Omnitrophota bacterium]
MKITTKFWIGLGVLVVLSPLGLLLPGHFKAGSAWGEWGANEVKGFIGYIPHGLEKLSSLWSAPLPGYAFKGWGKKPVASLSFAYILSAVVGILICVVVVLILGKFLSGKK